MLQEIDSVSLLNTKTFFGQIFYFISVFCSYLPNVSTLHLWALLWHSFGPCREIFLPAQTQSKSKATLRRLGWMKLWNNNIMFRIMIPLLLSIEMRGTSLQCRIFILLTFFILLILVLKSCFIEGILPTNCKMSTQFTKYCIFSVTEFYSIRCITSTNIKTPELSRGNNAV